MSEILQQSIEAHLELVDSMEGHHTLSVPASRRGAMTAHTVLQFEQMAVKHGTPRSLTVVPIPGVTLAKYGHNLCNGLPQDVQQGVVTRLEQFAPGQITTNVEEISCTWSSFSSFMQDCAEIAGVGKTTEGILQTNNHIANAQLPLADAFALWDTKVLKHLHERRTGKKVDVVALPSSLSQDLIDYKTGLLPNNRNVLPDAQINALCGRAEVAVHAMLVAYLENNPVDLENAYSRLHDQLSRALSSLEWKPLVSELQISPPELDGNVYKEAEALLAPLFYKAGVTPTPQEGWGIYDKMDSFQIDRGVVVGFVTRSAQPSKLLLAIDKRNRPHNTTYNHDDPEAVRYYTGTDVLRFLLRRAQDSGQTVLMQHLENRPDTLVEAATVLHGQNGKIRTLYAPPEDSLPMRDESVFLLM